MLRTDIERIGVVLHSLTVDKQTRRVLPIVSTKEVCSIDSLLMTLSILRHIDGERVLGIEKKETNPQDDVSNDGEGEGPRQRSTFDSSIVLAWLRSTDYYAENEKTACTYIHTTYRKY
jgi:hypothetical protein